MGKSLMLANDWHPAAMEMKVQGGQNHPQNDHCAFYFGSFQSFTEVNFQQVKVKILIEKFLFTILSLFVQGIKSAAKCKNKVCMHHT